MEIVKTLNLTKTYGKGENQFRALQGINLRLDQGELVAIMGPSGSGKSTLMHLMGGLDRPTGGEVWLNETRLDSLDDKALSALRRKQIGFIFQFYNLLPVLTARENVAMPLILDGVNRKTALEKADTILARVGLEDRANHRPTELSGGQQQRVSIARALVIEPTLILADEPTGALDSETGQDVMRILRNLVLHMRYTIAMVTHDPRVAAHADRIINIKDGRIMDDHRMHPSNAPVPSAAQSRPLAQPAGAHQPSL